jgi:anti-anti-sigma factor
MMSTSLTLNTVRGDDGTLALIAVGEIDLSNIDTFSQALTAATAAAVDSGRTLTVDLGAVEYLDSGAMNALVSHADRITLIAHPFLISALNVSGLNELIAIDVARPTGDGKQE